MGAGEQTGLQLDFTRYGNKDGVGRDGVRTVVFVCGASRLAVRFTWCGHLLGDALTAYQRNRRSWHNPNHTNDRAHAPVFAPPSRLPQPAGPTVNRVTGRGLKRVELGDVWR